MRRPNPKRHPPLRATAASTAAAPRPAPPGAIDPRRRDLLAAVALVALAVVVYLPVRNAGFVWDDNEYVTLNPRLRDAAGLGELWLNPNAPPQYYPLTFTTFWLEYHLWGARPLGYHLVNVALHATCAVLLWRLLIRLFVPGAWLAAALFAVHPVCVESVAWVTERKNVLSLALALGAAICYLRFASPEADRAAHDSRRRWPHFAAALLLFALALAAKSAVAPLPAVLLVIRWWKRDRIALDDVVPLLPFFALSIGGAMITRHVELENVLAVGTEWDHGPLSRLLIAGRAVCFYAGKLAWPCPVMIFYPRWNVDTHQPWQYLFPLAVVAVLVGLWRMRGRIGRGPLAAALIFAGMLAPALGFFNVYFMRYSYVADHFQYHAAPALLALLAAAATLAAAKWPAATRRVAPVTAAAWLLVLGAVTFHQARAYHDRETLYRDTIAKNPSSWNAYLNLGAVLDDQGQQEEACKMFLKALELKPDEPAIHISLCHILMQLGEQHGFRPGQLEQAIDHARQALALAPDDADAHRNLGFALILAGQPGEALAHFDQALASQPGMPEALYGRGSLLLASREWSQAQAAFERALQARPRYAEAHYGLAEALANQQRFDEAIAHLRSAVKADPGFAEAQAKLDVLLKQPGSQP